jgi:hypothetical protein
MVAEVAAAVEAGVSPMGLPQPPQNFAVGSFSNLHAGHGEGNGDPHWVQKRLVAAFSAMQLRQRICAPWLEPIGARTNTHAKNSAWVRQARAPIPTEESGLGHERKTRSLQILSALAGACGS